MSHPARERLLLRGLRANAEFELERTDGLRAAVGDAAGAGLRGSGEDEGIWTRSSYSKRAGRAKGSISRALVGS